MAKVQLLSRSSRLPWVWSPRLLVPWSWLILPSIVNYVGKVDALPKQLSSMSMDRWWRGVALGLLTSWLYFHILVHLVAQWARDPNFSHGFFVPIFSLFLLWQDRARLSSLRSLPSLWGLPVLVCALILLVLGVLGAELFLSRVSLLLVIAGLVIFFQGWDIFQAVLFPLAFLLLMIPLPAIIFNQITFPLQLLASI